MNNTTEENYKAMLLNFRVCDLQRLLKAFGRNIIGRKSELQNLALDILSSKPIGLNHRAYLIKILEVYNDKMRNSKQHQQARNMYKDHIIQLPQQRTQKMMQTYINPIDVKYNIPGNAMVNNNIQLVPSSYQPIRPNNAVSSQLPLNQHYYMSNMMTQNSMRFYLKTKNRENIPLILTPEIVAKYKFKKLPFYEVIEDIIKPVLLSGSEKCSLVTFCKGTKEITFTHTMSLEQASLISMNRNISYGQNKYLYQYQIRFCQLELGCKEVTDFLPLGLHIRIGDRVCTLSPIPPTQQINEITRPSAGPIDCTQLLKLNPNLVNHITLNWVPDEKNYAMAVFLVKKLSSDDLLNRLLKKELKSSEETRNYIITSLANNDPDLATTSYHFSLLCSLSKTRMNLPAKSIHCNHLQCFDAGTFILMNEKKPTWTCPICSKSCLYEEMLIENYFLEVVTSPLLQVNDKEIEILNNGSWIICKENKFINNTNSTLNTANPTVSIDLDGSGNEIATGPKKERVPKNSGKQESVDYINVDDNGDEIATEPKKDLKPKPSVIQRFIDFIDLDHSGDEIATESKKKLMQKSSGKQEYIDYINVDDSGDEIATEPKKKLMQKSLGKQEYIDCINVDDSDDEIATGSKIDLRPENSVIQEFIDFINLDDSDDETATKPKTKILLKFSEKQQSIEYISLDEAGNETVIEPINKLVLECSGKQESKNLKPLLVDMTINEDGEPLKHEDKLENEGQAADVGQSVSQLVLQPKDQVQPQQTVNSYKLRVVRLGP